MFYSQFNQDEILEKHIFKGFENGFFVDVGANDGVTINNTLFFEKERNWQGINIEPIPTVFSKLMSNRPLCTNVNVAIDTEDGTTEFLLNEGYTEMISGILQHYEPQHRIRLETELRQHGGKSTVVPIPTKRLQTILDENSVKHNRF